MSFCSTWYLSTSSASLFWWKRDALCAMSSHDNYFLPKLRWGTLNHTTQPPHIITFCQQQRGLAERRDSKDVTWTHGAEAKTYVVHDMVLLTQQSHSLFKMSWRKPELIFCLPVSTSLFLQNGFRLLRTMHSKYIEWYCQNCSIRIF